MLESHTPDDHRSTAEPSKPTRRTVIRWMVAAAGTGISATLGCSPLKRRVGRDMELVEETFETPVEEPVETTLDELVEPTTEEPGHTLYVVVAKEGVKFDEKRREDLGVLGPSCGTQEGPEGEFGYLGWFTAEAANRISKQQDIRLIETVTAEIPIEVGTSIIDEPVVIIVRLAPNEWGKKPISSTFVPNYVLADQWAGQFRHIHGAQVTADANLDLDAVCKSGMCRASLTDPASLPITIHLPSSKGIKPVLEVLQKHPQYYESEIFGASGLALIRDIIRRRSQHVFCPGCGRG